MALVLFSSQGTEAEAAVNVPAGGGWNATGVSETGQEAPVDPAASVLSGVQTTSLSLNSRCFLPVFGGYIEITKYDSTTFKKLAGAQFTIYNSAGKVVEVITSNAFGVAKSSKLSLGTYKVVETKAPAGYELESTPVTVALKACVTVCLKKYNKPACTTGNLNIKKVDENGRPLAGATFDVFNSSGTKVGTVTTNANGVAQLTNLPYGEYTLVETKAPDGYELNTTPIKVTISKTTPNPTVTVVNKKSKGGLEVVKKDEDGNPLAGAEFDVFNASGVKVATVTTGADGKAQLTGLPYGEYTLVETKAPPGYELNTTPIKVTVSAKTPNPSVTVVNKKLKGGLEVDKRDEAGNPLAGAEFDVFDASGTKVATITTGADGKAQLTGLPYGEYTLVETKAPPGYELNATPIKVTISATTPNPSVTVVNKESKGGLEVDKRDEAGNPLAGAEFDVFDASGTKVATITTGADGKAQLTGLPYGEYTLVETKAPDGYELDATPIKVTVSATTPNPSVTVVNKESKGGLEVDKRNEAGNPLAGAEFDVFDASGTKVATITTGADGKAQLTDLPYGEYTLVETKAPDGYELDATPIKVTVSKDTPNPSVTVVNKESRGGLEVIKEDETGKRLEGAIFDVFDASGTKIDTITTNAIGVAQLNNLPYGEYTLVETKAPDGYELDATPIKVTVSKDTPKPSVTVVNKEEEAELGSLKIIKYEKDSDPIVYLSDAVFEVYDKNYSLVGTYTTNQDGVILIDNLEPGTYYVVEKTAPPGYEEDNTFYPIEVKAGEVAEIAHPNVKINDVGALKIVKYARDAFGGTTTTTLPGATFKITYPDGSEVTEVTDENGEINLYNLAAGMYVIEETIAPPGYSLDPVSNVYTVGVTVGQTTIQNVYNRPTGQRFGEGRAVIFVTSTTLDTKGQKFWLIDSDNNVIQAETNNFGQISTYLPVGDYKILHAAASELTMQATELNFDGVEDAAAFQIQKDKLTIVNLKI
nr:SpaA isopeptide-forming pilin-related protein [Enterococcus larvae]